MSEILPPPPPSEGPTQQVTIRVPEKLLERIDKISKSSGHARATVMLHFLRWAAATYEAEKAQK